MRRFGSRLVLTLLAVGLNALLLASPATAGESTWVVDAQAAERFVVDDDRAQCPHARFRSIQAAVNKANAYGVIKVCAGRYAEQVTVDKPLEIEGDGASLMKTVTTGGHAETIDAVDCFSPTRPTFDPSTHVIVAPPLDAPSDVPTALFDLQADNIKLEGLVLQGNDNVALPASRAAVETSAAHSGFEIQYNLFLANTVATFLRSNGDHPSSFHHNCLRENGWGVANSFQPLIDARVHHNSTFRTRNFAYEATQCDALPCTSRIGMDRVTFDHNVSIEDDSAFLLWYSASTSVLENSVSSARVGARMFGNNEDLDIVGNDLEVRLAGIPQGTFPANRRLLIQGNTITGAGTAAGIGMGAGALNDSQILDNVISGLDGEGIGLLAGNTGNLVRGNVVLNSGRNGISAALGATGNTFELNQIHGSGRIVTTAVDARDGAWPSNVWRGNACETDVPAGAICGVE
jgi:hypothetical protein